LDVSFLNADPADRARLRRVVTAELSPRRLSEWASTAPDLVALCLKSMDDGPIDLVTSLAIPLPAAVLGELLGLAEPQRRSLLDWATTTLTPSATPPRARDTLGAMLALITAVAKRVNDEPGDTVVARLVHDRNDDLTADELAGLLFYLLFVWYEVLGDLVAGSVLVLLTRPEQRELLDTGRAPADASVDELLRYLSPRVLAGPRFAITGLDIGAHTVRAGETVLLCLASANHDPHHFVDPETVDLARACNPHLGLGYGGHACLGTALVRTITGTLLYQLVARWPDSRLAVNETEIAWRSGFRHRGPRAMARKMIFVNLPVEDLDRSKRFYESLGWAVNQDFTDGNAACVVIDDNICLMLLIKPFFETFTRRPIADTVATTGSIYALSLASAQDVDNLTRAALCAAGTEEVDVDKRAQEREVGMYGRTFVDPDGHHWEPFCMAPP
jgi:cytochrome P450/predicted lactoylglutathione lyase